MAKCRYCRQIIKGSSIGIALGADVTDTEQQVKACQPCAALYRSVLTAYRTGIRRLVDAQVKALRKQHADGKFHPTVIAIPGVGWIHEGIVDGPAAEGSDLDVLGRGLILEWAQSTLQESGVVDG